MSRSPANRRPDDAFRHVRIHVLDTDIDEAADLDLESFAALSLPRVADRHAASARYEDVKYV